MEKATDPPVTEWVTLHTTFRMVTVRIAPPAVPAPGGFGVVQGGAWHHHALPQFKKQVIPGVPRTTFQIKGHVKADAWVDITTADDDLWNRHQRYLRRAQIKRVTVCDDGEVRLRLHWRGWRVQEVRIRPAPEE